jgi:hypothetical protein
MQTCVQPRSKLQQNVSQEPGEDLKKNLNAVVSKLIVLKFANDVTLDDTKKRRYISSPSFTQ